jgi:Pyridoxamine 5'-phosphate oxidase
MDEEIRRKILALLEQHRIMTVATLRPDGWPQATTVGYASEGLTATIDPVMMASRFVVDVQSVISREKDPTEFGVVSIGSLRAAPQATSFLTRRFCSAPSEHSNRTGAPRCTTPERSPNERPG